MSGQVEKAGQAEPDTPRAARLFRAFEAGSVICVVLGPFILSSIASLPGVEVFRGSLHVSYYWFYTAIQLAAGFALLTYMLVRKSLEAPIPRGISRRLVESLKQIRMFEWGLVAVVALWKPVSHQLLTGPLVVEWIPISILRNFRGSVDLVEMGIGLTVLGYVLRQSGRTFYDIGLHWSSRSAALAMPLFIADKVIWRVQFPIVLWLGKTFGPAGWHQPDVGFMLFGSEIEFAEVAQVLLVGFFEELIVRAYLMTEIMTLTRNAWLAVTISVLVQTSYHLYQGVPLALSHLGFFTVYALFYLRKRLILPVAIAHSLVDVNAIWNYGLKTLSHL